MDERLRFFAKLLDGESMSELYRSFGISRKTGYKIFTRYKAEQLGGVERPLASCPSGRDYWHYLKHVDAVPSGLRPIRQARHQQAQGQEWRRQTCSRMGTLQGNRCGRFMAATNRGEQRD